MNLLLRLESQILLLITFIVPQSELQLHARVYPQYPQNHRSCHCQADGVKLRIQSVRISSSMLQQGKVAWCARLRLSHVQPFQVHQLIQVVRLTWNHLWLNQNCPVTPSYLDMFGGVNIFNIKILGGISSEGQVLLHRALKIMIILLFFLLLSLPVPKNLRQSKTNSIRWTNSQ